MKYAPKQAEAILQWFLRSLQESHPHLNRRRKPIQASSVRLPSDLNKIINQTRLLAQRKRAGSSRFARYEIASRKLAERIDAAVENLLSSLPEPHPAVPSPGQIKKGAGIELWIEGYLSPLLQDWIEEVLPKLRNAPSPIAPLKPMVPTKKAKSRKDRKEETGLKAVVKNPFHTIAGWPNSRNRWRRNE